MTLKQIARPALLVAPDGWVAVTTRPEDLEAWNPGAVKRYAAMGVEVFSADHRIWKFEGFDVVASPTFLEKLRMWSMGLPALSTVDIHLREEPGDALGRLRAAFQAALEKDCDCKLPRQRDISEVEFRAVGFSSGLVCCLSLNWRGGRFPRDAWGRSSL